MFDMMVGLHVGSFIAKVTGSGGWIVSPSKMTVECAEDGCAQGKDVNFEVVGFTLRGRIEGADIDGCKDAPSTFDSVTVVLQPKGMQNDTLGFLIRRLLSMAVKRIMKKVLCCLLIERI